jgi:hypothetical protein
MIFKPISKRMLLFLSDVSGYSLLAMDWHFFSNFLNPEWTHLLNIRSSLPGRSLHLIIIPVNAMLTLVFLTHSHGSK